MWNNDTSYKLIDHPTNSKIPLMPVNETDGDEFSAFLAHHSDSFTDNFDEACLISSIPSPTQSIEPPNFKKTYLK